MIQSLAVKKFKAEIEQTEFEFTVVKGGISNVAETSIVCRFPISNANKVSLADPSGK